MCIHTFLLLLGHKVQVDQAVRWGTLNIQYRIQMNFKYNTNELMGSKTKITKFSRISKYCKVSFLVKIKC